MTLSRTGLENMRKLGIKTRHRKTFSELTKSYDINRLDVEEFKDRLEYFEKNEEIEIC